MFTFLKQQVLQAADTAEAVFDAGMDFIDFGSNAQQAEALDRSTAQAGPAPLDPSSIPPFNDGGGYFWQACEDGSFACVETPTGKERALGTVVTAGGNPDAWSILDTILQAKVAEFQPPAADAPPPPPAPPVPADGLFGLLPDALRALEEAAEGAVDAVEDLLQIDPIAAVKAWWADEDGADEAARDGQSQTPSEADVGGVADKEARRQELLDSGVKDNLEVAEALAEDLNVPHGYDDAGKNVEGDVTDAGKRRAAIEAGNEDALKSVLCSEFTNLTLADAGWDLTQEYVDPDTQKRVCYAESGGGVTFVTIFMVVNTQWEATGAVLDVQRGDAEEIAGGSDRAKEIGADGQSGTFWYSTASHFKDTTADASQEFGAGLAAQALGGDEVDPADRKPGDLQQWLYVKDGKHKGYGHSSQVWAVKGYGVVYLGGDKSPTLEGGPSDLAPGWYDVGADSGAKVLIQPDTDPARVATFTTHEAQLIDANQGRGNDATGTGSFGSEDGHADRVLSNGRLPTSKWYPWAPDGSQVGASLASPAAQSAGADPIDL